MIPLTVLIVAVFALLFREFLRYEKALTRISHDYSMTALRARQIAYAALHKIKEEDEESL